MSRHEPMKFSNRMLMVLTPIGVAIGLYEAWQLAGKMVFLMAAQMIVLATVVVVLVRKARRESRQSPPQP